MIILCKRFTLCVTIKCFKITGIVLKLSFFLSSNIFLVLIFMDFISCFVILYTYGLHLHLHFFLCVVFRHYEFLLDSGKLFGIFFSQIFLTNLDPCHVSSFPLQFLRAFHKYLHFEIIPFEFPKLPSSFMISTFI